MVKVNSSVIDVVCIYATSKNSHCLHHHCDIATRHTFCSTIKSRCVCCHADCSEHIDLFVSLRDCSPSSPWGESAVVGAEEWHHHNDQFCDDYNSHQSVVVLAGGETLWWSWRRVRIESSYTWWKRWWCWHQRQSEKGTYRTSYTLCGSCSTLVSDLHDQLHPCTCCRWWSAQGRVPTTLIHPFVAEEQCL